MTDHQHPTAKPEGEGAPRFAMIWLDRTYPDDLVDALNGYITGGSGRCLEALEALGVTIMARTADASPPGGEK